MSRSPLSFLIVAVAVVLLLPSSASAATCADYSNQAAAQRAADTRDGDGDGIYCESLPCPCAGKGDGGGSGSSSPPPKRSKPSCVRNRGVANIGFSKTKYPNIRRHYRTAVGKGWPRSSSSTGAELKNAATGSSTNPVSAR